MVGVWAASLAQAERIAKGFDVVLCCGPKQRIAHPQWFGQEFVDKCEGVYAPRRDQIAALLDYAHSHPGRTLCYCHQGVSRSVAVAIGVAITQGEQPTEARKRLGSNANPNRLILAHVASLLSIPYADLA